MIGEASSGWRRCNRAGHTARSGSPHPDWRLALYLQARLGPRSTQAHAGALIAGRTCARAASGLAATPFRVARWITLLYALGDRVAHAAPAPALLDIPHERRRASSRGQVDRALASLEAGLCGLGN
jgi:hypothetical protein